MKDWIKAVKMFLCRHEWEHHKEVDWYGNNLIECHWKQCRKCGKAVFGNWMQIGGCKDVGSNNRS